MECWVNKQLPSNPINLSKLLGLNESEVISSLPKVMSFFKIDGDFMISPELEDYRSNLEAIRQKQSKAGKDAASKINSKRKSKIADSSLDSSPVGLVDSSLIQSNSKQYNQIQSIEKEIIKDSFVSEMEEYEAHEGNLGNVSKKRFMRI